MNTLHAQKVKLERELVQAEEQIYVLSRSARPDFKRINQLKDMAKRHQTLIQMIDDHDAFWHGEARKESV